MSFSAGQSIAPVARNKRGVEQPPSYHSGGVGACGFAPDLSWAVSGGWDGALIRWDPATGELLNGWHANPKAITALAVSPDGMTIASGCMDGMVGYWDALSGRMLARRLDHAGPVAGITYAPAGRALVTASYDGTLHISFPGDPEREVQVLRGHNGPVTGAAFTPDGRHVLSWSHDGTFRLWETNRGLQLSRWTLPGVRFVRGAVALDGRHFVLAGADGLILLWDAAVQLEAGRWLSDQEPVGLFFGPDVSCLLVVQQSGEIAWLSVPGLAELGRRDLGRPTTAAALAPAGLGLAFGVADGLLYFSGLPECDGRPIRVSPLEALEERTPGKISWFGRSSATLQRVRRCLCPACRRLNDLALDFHGAMTCPGCARILEINETPIFF